MYEGFTKVVMRPGMRDIARVNRKTGVLYLNPNVWEQLPTDQKEFVLFHEEGHLKLQTASEYQANRYAIKKFTELKTLHNRPLGQKIMVMREILDKADDGYESGFGIVEAVAGAASGITQSLGVLGIGSKSRRKESDNLTENQLRVIEAQAAAANENSKVNAKYIALGGALLLVLAVIFLTLNK
nr:hypothetical protein [uncultured Draconibacterium sp.]